MTMGIIDPQDWRRLQVVCDRGLLVLGCKNVIFNGTRIGVAFAARAKRGQGKLSVVASLLRHRLLRSEQ